jgi:hypothetical protein
MIKAAIDFTLSRCDKTKEQHATGWLSASSATGYRSASSATGHQSASSATGYQSASSATGDQSASSATGYQSASSATGYRSASSATGHQSASSATGYQSSVCIVDTDKIKSKESIAAGFGRENKAKASAGNWIVLANRNEKGEILHIKSAKVGEGIKADTWYTLDDSGKFVRAE